MTITYFCFGERKKLNTIMSQITSILNPFGDKQVIMKITQLLQVCTLYFVCLLLGCTEFIRSSDHWPVFCTFNVSLPFYVSPGW